MYAFMVELQFPQLGGCLVAMSCFHKGLLKCTIFIDITVPVVVYVAS